MAMAATITQSHLTPERIDTFLQGLAEFGNVTMAARLAGASRQAFYLLKQEDLNFEIQWASALEEATDELELEARRRAVEGHDEPIYQGGEKVGVKRKYSDALLITLLAAHRPDKFSKRIEHTGKDGGPIELAKVLESIPTKDAGGATQGKGEE